jgi:GWxTD domain-containing protein
MLKYFTYTIVLIISLLLVSSELQAEENFFLDAIAFGGNDTSEAYIDAYVVIPYQLLTFESTNNKFVANLELRVQVKDKDNKTIGTQKSQKTLVTDSYNSSQGGEAEFVKFYYRFPTKAGTFTVEAELSDKFSSGKYERTREVTAIEFGKYNLSLSGIMLLSQIEEVGSHYKITPYISDNINQLDGHFFAFLEIYNKNEPKTIKLAYKLLKEEKIIFSSKLKEVKLEVGKNQNYFYVDVSELNLIGAYVLQIIAYDSTASDTNSQKVLAITQRSIKNEGDVSASFLEVSTDEAIKMLRYVASSDEIEKMQNAKSEDLKKEMLRMFWKNLDPTPNTRFNEAMNEYYERVKYANKQFKSYTEGWLSDMGMVYIVLGPPMQVEKQSAFGSNVEYRLWRYSSNESFLFADRNGFGNFRLEGPYLFNEKYKYKK